MIQQNSNNSTTFWLKLIVKVVFITGPLTLIGLLFCLTVVGVPLGVPLIMIACKPIANMFMADQEEKIERLFKENPAPELDVLDDWRVPSKSDRIKELFNE